MARAEKVSAVAELTERFQSSAGAVLTEYRGLSVAQLGELRHTLGENATFAVVKNTLTKIAASEAGVAGELTELLSGPSAIAAARCSCRGEPTARNTNRAGLSRTNATAAANAAGSRSNPMGGS